MKDFKEIIAEQIAKATNIEKDKIITNIEVPKDTNNGDFAFPCFILAKELRKSPVMIANDLQESIREQINANNVDEISEVNAVNGFLNFKLNQNKIAEEVIKNFNKMQDKCGSETQEKDNLMKAIRLLGCMPEEKIDVNQYRSILQAIFTENNNILSSLDSPNRSNLHRMIRIYDFLEYGQKKTP